jgi:uncharacterized protein YuzE
MEKIKGKLKFDYDKSNDVLYSFIDKPQSARSEEVEGGVLIRVDSRVHKIVGFTVLDFKRRIKDGYLKKIPCFEDIDINKLLMELENDCL